MDAEVLDNILKTNKKPIQTMSKREFKKYWNDRADIYKQVEEIKKIKGDKAMSEKNGIYTNKLTDKTPDWIVCKLGIKVDELPKPNEKGFINIDICRTKDGSYYYAKLNDYGLTKENITSVEDFNF